MGAQLPKKPHWWGGDLNGVSGDPNSAQDASSAALTNLPDNPITSANLVGSTPEGINKKAADWAQSQTGSTDYQVIDRSNKTGGWRSLVLGGRAAPKCNIFVGDAFAKAGIQVDNPVANGAAYPGTKEWADAQVKIPGFQVLGPSDKLRRGDVITNGHHVGIYMPGPNGEDMTVSAADMWHGDAVVHNNWGFRGDEGRVVARRFVGTP
jgi:hypothetical protein